MPYRSVTLVEDAVKAVASRHPSFTTLIPLPERTWEGRDTHAIRVGAGTGRKVGLYFSGCVHAREWGSAEILLRLVESLTDAYRAGQALRLGSRTFTAAEVKRVVEGLNLYVFPQANPDGRHYSMTTDLGWRKNRRPATDPRQAGVDVNRNFDFLWDYPRHFSPDAAVFSSKNAVDETYIGPAADSEPETRNVQSIVRDNRDIRFYVDLHSYTQVILYGWGDDDMQSADPAMSYRNPAYDDDRGVKGDAAYREYLPAPDVELQQRLAVRLRDGIVRAGGPAYTPKASFDLYAQSGVSTEWCHRRWLDDRANGKVHGLTVEWGTEFQPPWATMAKICDEVSAGLLELCLGVLDSYSDTYLRHHDTDTGDAGAADPFWESPDIVVRHLDDGVMENQELLAGQDNYVYVRFHNRGPRPTRQVKVGMRAAAFAGTQFRYQHDWTAADETHIQPARMVDTFDNVPVGASRVAKFHLSAAQTRRMGDWQAAGWHPCLLAEVDCVTDYSAPGVHSWESNNIAQRNVTVVNAPAEQAREFAFLVGHELDDANPTKIRIDAEGLIRGAIVTVDTLDDRVRFPAVTPDKILRAADLVTVPPVPSLPGLPDPGPVLGQVEGAEVVAHGVVQLVGSTAKMELRRVRGLLNQVVATVTLPPGTPRGAAYVLRVTELDEADRAVGGVTLELRVPR